MEFPSDSPFWSRLRLETEPVAHPANIVGHRMARFTMLTPRLLRMEWSENGHFEDRGTFAFPGRRGAAVPFTADTGPDGTLTIDTGALRLAYRPTGAFDADNLTIEFPLDGDSRRWRPGDAADANLRGTRRTLDVCAGDAPLELGLLSRAGWTLFDDSAAVLFDETGWVVPRPPGTIQDWYFFGYGHDYTAALRDYTSIAGRIPLIPRFVLGAWWSRYWSYTDQDVKDIVDAFAAHALPLDVVVLDMDWHVPDYWTGYSWNRELFPDPRGFMAWLHERGLRTTLNLHPADGVQPFEDQYAAFATAMGVDPATNESIPFLITDRRFTQLYFELLHHPLEDEGVDFWWMDWQQGATSEMAGLDPLPWLNHLHFLDARRRGIRPMLYSRWGGLGNHRYPIGFSGDTYATWAALQFQPYFTATASNVGYGWWSHDIGGHIGATEPELFARWVQYGAVSPCMRLHAMKDPLAERRPWAYPPPILEASQAAFHLRYQLIPYLYTMARVASDTGVSLCRPMYYEHPKAEAAYHARYHYMLGDTLLAAPIVHPSDKHSGLASADVWLPPGRWIAWDTAETLEGPGWVRLLGDIQRLPLLARVGAIVPLAPVAATTDAQPRDHLIVVCVVGADGEFRLYEDDGTTEAYTHGDAEWTRLALRMQANGCTLSIEPVEGRCSSLPHERGYEIRFLGASWPDCVVVDGAEHQDWTYDAERLTASILVSPRAKSAALDIQITARHKGKELDAEHNQRLIREDLRRLLGADTTELAELVKLPDEPRRNHAVARIGGPFAHAISAVTPDEAADKLGSLVLAGPTDASSFEVDISWRLFDPRGDDVRVEQISATREAQHLAVPFAFDGIVQPRRWEADVTFHWRGASWTERFRGVPLFPAVPTWRALVFDRSKQQLAFGDVLDDRGWPRDADTWELYLQDPSTMRVPNLSTPYGIRFVDAYRPRLRAGEPLAAFVAATITCPDERDAVIRVPAHSPTELMLNGQPIALAAGDEGTGNQLYPSYFRPHRSVTVRLRTGDNSLVLASEPPGAGQWWAWFASAIVEWPDGSLMTDLQFSA